MKKLRFYLVFFLLAAIWAFQTWSRTPVMEEDAEQALAWDRDSTQFVAVSYRSPGAAWVEVERRTDDEGALYLWGTQVEEGESEEQADTLQFPVGEQGHFLMRQLAQMRVIRELGAISPEQQAVFGIAGSEERITIRFQDGGREEVHELLVGDSIFGGRDRYVLDETSGESYVISSEVVRPLATGEGALRERLLHHYLAGDVHQVRVSVEDSERHMERTEDGEWVRPGASTDDEATGESNVTPDLAFANFMERVDQLAIAGYKSAPEPGTMRLLLRVEYLDEDGEELGYLELFHDGMAERDLYYMRSERTRVMAEAVGALAERVEEGLAGVF